MTSIENKLFEEWKVAHAFAQTAEEQLLRAIARAQSGEGKVAAEAVLEAVTLRIEAQEKLTLIVKYSRLGMAGTP
jgi:hypothetical protein